MKPPLLGEFRTPIVKVKSLEGDEVKSFYSMADYNGWKSQHADKLSEWNTRHYKGLGTHTRKEGQKYFTHIADHKRDFVWDGKDDGKAIDCAFNENIEDRKQLIQRIFDLESHQSHHHETEAGQINFTKKDLVAFLMADIRRSIPSMIDGLKPVQRKILHCFLNRSSNKVSQVSALVSGHSVYYHSDQCLNNQPSRWRKIMLGVTTRHCLNPLVNSVHGKGWKRLCPLFPKEDFKYAASLQDEDEKNIEPQWYYPIIPTILVNGCEGIGSG